MGRECRCINPEGGSTKCPNQHVAICIRGKDKECHGECVPIPKNYHSISDNFNYWLQNNIKEALNDYAQKYYKSQEINFILEELSFNERVQGGKSTYRLGNILMYVQYSFEFNNDIEPLGGPLVFSVR